MEKNQILEKINENLEDLDNVENEISMIELAIYEKSLEDLKDKKTKEVREFFEQKARFYNQKIEKYDHEINKNIKKYQTEMEKIINAYNNLYINIFRIMENAINNQKIAIANIVTLTEKIKKENLKDKELEKTKNTIIACAEKKLNYSVIIDECKARIKWCIEDTINNINEIFKNNIYQLQIYNENIFYKIKRNFLNIFSGKSNYKKFIENYESEYLRKIKKQNNLKIIDITATTNGIIKQMEETKKQITIKYEERLCA